MTLHDKIKEIETKLVYVFDENKIPYVSRKEIYDHFNTSSRELLEVVCEVVEGMKMIQREEDILQGRVTFKMGYNEAIDDVISTLKEGMK